MSTPSSPSASPTLGRRLSARRGSVSANDPYGAYASINNHPTRALTSKLTIVRVPPPQEEDPNAGRKHRRHGSNASVSSTSSRGEPSRLSFAMTSFSSPSAGGTGGSNRPASPNGSPRMSPVRRYSGSGAGSFGATAQQKLSPDQLVELARSSCNPRPSVSGGVSGTNPPSPVPPQPVSFTPLPDGIFLPFIERPLEVRQLVSTPPTAKLFALLAQTFTGVSASKSNQASPAYPNDPRHWTYSDLVRWLTTVDRGEADDALYVAKARACVLPHSELIWERIKGALGIPPELDVEFEGLEAAPLSPMTEEARQALLDAESALADSPIASFGPSFAGPRPQVELSPSIQALPSIQPGLDEDELEPSIMIEAVVASSTPPPTSAANDHQLAGVREEDESDEGRDPEEPEVQGLRFTTSPMHAPVFSPSPSASVFGHSPSASPARSPLALPSSVLGTSPGSFSMHDRDAPYDPMRERGPGNPLFPSSFAQLSLAPTLRPDQIPRAQSMSYALGPNAGTGSLRAGSDAQGPRAALRSLRNDWSHAWDPARHEHAVASSAGSVSGFEL